MFSMTNLLRRVFNSDPYSVTDVRVSDYVHWNVIERDQAIIIHSCEKEQNQMSFEILLYRETPPNSASAFW